MAFAILCRIFIIVLMFYFWVWCELRKLMELSRRSAVPGGKPVEYDYELTVVFGRVLLWTTLLVGAGAFDALPVAVEPDRPLPAEQAEK